LQAGIQFKVKGGNANTVTTSHHSAKVVAVATTMNDLHNGSLNIGVLPKLVEYKLQKMHQNGVRRSKLAAAQCVVHILS